MIFPTKPIEQWDGLRVLTVREPWATLIVMGFKDIENRCRPFSHRGPLLIHASKAHAKWEYDESCKWVMTHVPENRRPARLPTFDEARVTFGKIVGGCELVDCAPYESRSISFFKLLPFGNSPWFDHSDYALVLSGAWKAVEPVPFKGQLCLGTFGNTMRLK